MVSAQHAATYHTGGVKMLDLLETAEQDLKEKQRKAKALKCEINAAKINIKFLKENESLQKEIKLWAYYDFMRCNRSHNEREEYEEMHSFQYSELKEIIKDNSNFFWNLKHTERGKMDAIYKEHSIEKVMAYVGRK
jgi:hypothetical protein